MINPSNVLTEANNNACTMLIKMTTPADVGTAKTTAIIPLPSLRDCSVRVSTACCILQVFCYLHPMQALKFPELSACAQGLQFFDLKLVGAVASYLHGSAFTIRKLGKQDGITQWSAPCFLQMHQLGLGLTVGE